MDGKNKPFSGWKIFIPAILIPVLLFQAYAGYKVHMLSVKQEKIKADYCTVNSVVFGLFSISEWKDKLTDILDYKINHFSFSTDQKVVLKKEVEDILHALIDKTVKMINEKNKTFADKLKRAAFNTFIDEKELHDKVPEYADEIVKKATDKGSKRNISKLVKSKMTELGKETYDSSRFVQATVRDSIFNKYGVDDLQEFEQKTKVRITEITQENYLFACFALFSAFVILLTTFLLRRNADLVKFLFILSVISALVLLLVGLTTTMIEVDARISKLEMVLMGKTILFENQVLFFQSKSILAVVKVLLTAGTADSVFVGFLIFCFSMVFPVAKLISLLVYYLGDKPWTRGKVISFFVHKSGKWSMADVMVIGIFMTYIGFNGILESQLENLQIHNGTLTSITTNNTSLQPGYIVFVGFVLFGLVLSTILDYIKKREHNPEVN